LDAEVSGLDVAGAVVVGGAVVVVGEVVVGAGAAEVVVVLGAVLAVAVGPAAEALLAHTMSVASAAVTARMAFTPAPRRGRRRPLSS
jgi:hypothetical protein